MFLFGFTAVKDSNGNPPLSGGVKYTGWGKFPIFDHDRRRCLSRRRYEIGSTCHIVYNAAAAADDDDDDEDDVDDDCCADEAYFHWEVRAHQHDTDEPPRQEQHAGTDRAVVSGRTVSYRLFYTQPPRRGIKQ